MSDTVDTAPFDLEEQRARINRAIDESSKLRAEQTKFTAEQAKLAAEQAKLAAEQTKLAAEERKLFAEALKLERDRALAPWQIVITSMAAGAALFGAGAAFIKLLGT